MVVDRDDDDVSARIVAMEAVAGDAQIVFGDFTQAEKAEDEAGDRRPQKQLPRLQLGNRLCALRLLRLILPDGRPRMRAKRLAFR